MIETATILSYLVIFGAGTGQGLAPDFLLYMELMEVVWEYSSGGQIGLQGSGWLCSIPRCLGGGVGKAGRLGSHGDGLPDAYM